VPAGTRCAVRNLIRGGWLPFTTTRASGFERYERYERTPDGAFYESRAGVWVLRVHRRHVVHREDADRLAVPRNGPHLSHG
jgi:hypothetical protein